MTATQRAKSLPEGKPGRVNTWVERDVFDGLVELAELDMRSVSAEARKALKAWVEAPENIDKRAKR